MDRVLLDTTALGPVLVRRAPEVRQTPDSDDRYYVARVLLPGVATAPFADPTLGEVRLRLPANMGEGSLREGQLITLGGRTVVNAWYLSGGRGQSATSDVTVTPELVHDATGQRRNRGLRLLPCQPPTDEPFTLLDFLPNDRDASRVDVTLMAPTEVRGNVGTVAVSLLRPADGLDVLEDMVDRPVRLAGLKAKVVVVTERAEVRRGTRASFVFYADRLEVAEPEPVGASAGRPRRHEPVAEPSAEGGES